MDVPLALREKLNSLPAKPGVYLYRDARGAVIYVGKAVNLRNRVRSYFHAGAEQSLKTARLLGELADLEWIITESELEALVLECNLIKQHRPRFNIRLKDDKRYPYIKVTWQETFPRVEVTRTMARDGARYFGPYTNAGAVYQTLDTLRKIFPYLTCDREITGRDRRACMYYDIKRCAAPCIGAVTAQEYRAIIEQLCNFLEGRTETVEAHLRQKMREASEALQYERAAWYRDQLKALQHIAERQKVVSTTFQDQDVVAFAREDGDACVQVFFIRQGKLIGREYFVLEGAEDRSPRDILSGFLKQFYEKAAAIPPEVLLQTEVEEALIIEQWLRQKRGGSVALAVPQEGIPAELVQMAADNAAEMLASLRARWQADAHKHEQALQELADALGLAALPARIECYDISQTQGTAIVGAMVVFVKGIPRKADYRKFNIKTVSGEPDDFASMREMLTRRFKRYQSDRETPHVVGQKRDASFALLPDLLVVDGGKGQLGVAVQVLREFDLLDKIPVVALAKQEEEIFVPGRAEAILLPRRSAGLFLIQRIRDEAHRFAISTHRALRNKIGLAGQLDAIPGIGPARRKALLRQFGSLEGIRAASLDELAQVVPRHVAESLKAHLNE